MKNKPIGPELHSAIDYGFAATQFLAPTLLGLTGVARVLSYTFATNTLIINLLSKTPLGVKKVIPMKMHGQLETPIVPVLLLLPWALGAFKQKNAGSYFVLFFLAATTNFLLTNYDAPEAQ